LVAAVVVVAVGAGLADPGAGLADSGDEDDVGEAPAGIADDSAPPEPSAEPLPPGPIAETF